jgi:hypothetical protein
MNAQKPDTPRNRSDRDAPHMSPVTPAEDVRTVMIYRVSWGAVLAGVVVALVTQLVLNMLGFGIGAATLDPMTGDNPSVSNFSLGAGLWFAAAGIVRLLWAATQLAGCPASRLSRQPVGTAYPPGRSRLSSYSIC